MGPELKIGKRMHKRIYFPLGLRSAAALYAHIISVHHGVSILLAVPTVWTIILCRGSPQGREAAPRLDIGIKSMLISPNLRLNMLFINNNRHFVKSKPGCLYSVCSSWCLGKLHMGRDKREKLGLGMHSPTVSNPTISLGSCGVFARYPAWFVKTGLFSVR